MTPSDYSMTRLLDDLILPSAGAIAALSFCVHAGVAAQQPRPGQTEKRPDVPPVSDSALPQLPFKTRLSSR